jgi:hypothetical protein
MAVNHYTGLHKTQNHSVHFCGRLYRIVVKSDENCRKYGNVSQISQLLKGTVQRSILNLTEIGQETWEIRVEIQVHP